MRSPSLTMRFGASFAFAALIKAFELTILRLHSPLYQAVTDSHLSDLHFALKLHYSYLILKKVRKESKIMS